MKHSEMMSVSLKEYMDQEADIAYDNMKHAEDTVKHSMDKLVAIIMGYRIDMSHFSDITSGYDKNIRELNAIKRNATFKDIKRITVHLELVNEEIQAVIKTFPVQQKRLIEEAAATADDKNCDTSTCSN